MMDATDKYMVKVALETLRAAGGTGVKRRAILSQMGDGSGPTTLDERNEVFHMIEERGWVDYHLDPIWHEKRWTITERGLTALEGM